MSYQYAHSHLDCPTCVKVGNETNRLREENARLRLNVSLDLVTKLTSERDEARAEVKQAKDLHLLEFEKVKRLEGLILDWESSFATHREDALKAEARRIRGEGSACADRAETVEETHARWRIQGEK